VMTRAIMQLDGRNPRDAVKRDDLRKLYRAGVSLRSTLAHAGTAAMEEAKRLEKLLPPQL